MNRTSIIRALEFWGDPNFNPLRQYLQRKGTPPAAPPLAGPISTMASSAPPYFHPIPQPPPPAPPQPPTSIQTEPPLSAATLLVRHLPEAIPEDMLSRLFSHYGASSVRPCVAGRLRNCAFVDFMDEAMATQAQGKLNRLRLLGKVLTVERAVNPRNNHQSSVQSVKELSVPPASMLKDASIKSKNSVSCGEPIAARLGVEYPFPPHLEYEYPPPDKNILTNIVNALIAVPRFYTQVLHLMNKMNIPAPFRMALPTPPLHPPQAPASPPPSSPIAAKPKSAESSSDESEWESSEEDGVGARTAKRARREAIVGPAIDKAVSHEAVGLKPVTLVPKEAQVIKKKNPVLQIKIIPKTTQKLIDDQPKEHAESIEEQPEQKPYATPQEIESGKLPPEEILSLPKFKNYVAGNPASVLYVKNLAKDVVEDDFYFIFGSLFRGVEAARSNLNVDLKKEGRMRGQAFLTFPSAELAHRALNLVNGYVFKGKPIIIQFGRKSADDKVN